jgi:hypothetical protein
MSTGECWIFLGFLGFPALCDLGWLTTFRESLSVPSLKVSCNDSERLDTRVI